MVLKTCAVLHTCSPRVVQTIHMVSNLPHIAVRLPGTKLGIGVREALLMVDLGASGIDIIFHSKAVKELGLQDLPKAGAIQLKACSFHCTVSLFAQTWAEGPRGPICSTAGSCEGCPALPLKGDCH